jgi:hypothetical protein
MERSQIRHDETGRVAMTVAPDREHGASSPMTAAGTSLMTGTQAHSAGDVTGRALQLAMSALRIDLAWHAGMVSAEAAMECLHHEIAESVSRSNESERAELPRSPETPMRTRPQIA